MKKFKIGDDVKIKTCNTIGFITQMGYEVAWMNKDGDPCKGYFTPLELALSNKNYMGFSKKETENETGRPN